MPSDIIFNPSIQLAEVILEQFASPAHSLVSIAAAHDTTLDALTFWATRPDIQQRIKNNIAFASQRAHWATVSQVHASASALGTMLHAYERDESKLTISENNEGAIIRDRLRSGARRAAWLILRTARSFPDSIPESVLTQADQTAKRTTETQQVVRPEVGRLADPSSDLLSGLFSRDAITANPEAAAHLQALFAVLAKPTSAAQSVPSSGSGISNLSSEIPTPISPPSPSASSESSAFSSDPDSGSASDTALSAPPPEPTPDPAPRSIPLPLLQPPPPSRPSLAPSSAHLPFPSTSARTSLSTRTIFDKPAIVPGAPTLAEVADNDRELDPARPFKGHCTIPERHLERLRPCQRQERDIIDSS